MEKVKILEQVKFVDINSIKLNQEKLKHYQPEPENYDFIKQTISERGIVEPLMVDVKTKIIISGNLRYRIAKELEMNIVPVIFTHVLTEDMDLVSHLTDVQRIKSSFDLLHDIQYWDEHFKIGKGKRTDLDPDLKEKKELRDELSKVSHDKKFKLKKIHELASELYGDGSPEYLEIFHSIDIGRTTINGQYQTLIDRKNRRRNEAVVPDHYDIIRENTKIYNHSSEDMSEIEDNSIHNITCSPPYFLMKLYFTKDELGQEHSVELYLYNMMKIFNECKRVLRDDGSLFVIINDCVIDNQYQAVPQKFVVKMMENGWLFNDEMIWIKNNPTYTRGMRSVRSHEYIYHFVKTPNFYYTDEWLKELEEIDNEIAYGAGKKSPKVISGLDFRGNVLRTNVSSTADLRKKCAERNFYMSHSATYPIDVPSICGFCTTKDGDTMLDCFAGTSVTGEFARRNNRKFIGYELNPEFIKASEVRLSQIGELWNLTNPELARAMSYLKGKSSLPKLAKVLERKQFKIPERQIFEPVDLKNLKIPETKPSFKSFSNVFGSVINILNKYD